MRTRNLVFSSLVAVALVLVSAFTNCSSQKENAVDQALNSSSTGTGTDAGTVDTGDSAIPAGAIMPMAIASCPTGWIAADGSEQLRSAFTKLFAALGTTYGAGDGSTTFKLPDYRGYFLRGANSGSGADPEAASRTDRGDGTGGDVVGSKQTDQYRSHNHYIAGGILYTGGGGGSTVSGGQVGAAYTEPNGGTETRPKNISVLYCISTGGQ